MDDILKDIHVNKCVEKHDESRRLRTQGVV